MSNTVYFAQLAGADMTMEPGAFDGGEYRNDGPALWLDDGSGGVIAECADRESMIEILTDLLERAKAMPEPAPDAECRNCGRAIRYLEDRSGDTQWLHRPFTLPGLTSDEFTDECLDEDGDPLTKSGTEPTEWHPFTAEPASDPEASPQPGDQVLDMREPDEDHPRVVWEIQYGGQVALDNDHVRTPDELLVITRHVPEVQES